MTYAALAAGVGPIEAKNIMRTAHRSPLRDVLALLDAAHARLHTERRDVALAQEAVATIAAEPVDDPRPTDAMAISELAGALGVLTSTLRYWDLEGLLTPARSSGGGARIYSPADVRDARIVHQLRLAGHRSPRPRDSSMPVLRHSRRNDDITAALHAREESITAPLPSAASVPPARHWNR
ncbi:MAG: MerR family transcriptional regulator [Nocardioidaceae bacterium]